MNVFGLNATTDYQGMEYKKVLLPDYNWNIELNTHVLSNEVE